MTYNEYQVREDGQGNEFVWHYKTESDQSPEPLIGKHELSRREGGFQLWKDIRDMIDARQEEGEERWIHTTDGTDCDSGPFEHSPSEDLCKHGRFVEAL